MGQLNQSNYIGHSNYLNQLSDMGQSGRSGQSRAPSTTMPGGEWTLLDASGGTALTFASFLDIDQRNEGQALSYPVERGGFAHYNKVHSPRALRVTLGFQGGESDFEYALKTLDEYREQAVLLAVATPAALYESMTLQSYGYSRRQDSGAGMLLVDLSLVEVREVETQVTASVITSPRNPTSAGTVNTGKKQTESARTGGQNQTGALFGLSGKPGGA